jgi:alpha-galactosidase
MDLDSQRLELMEAVAKRFIAQAGSDLQVEITTDRRTALSGADFVIVSIASAGAAMYEYDIDPCPLWHLYHGGETVGPGG